MERAVILSQGEEIDTQDLLSEQQSESPKSAWNSEDQEIDNYANAKLDFEKNYLNALLKHTKGNIASASQISGQYRANLYRMIKKHDLNPFDYK